MERNRVKMPVWHYKTYKVRFDLNVHAQGWAEKRTESGSESEEEKFWLPREQTLSVKLRLPTKLNAFFNAQKSFVCPFLSSPFQC